MIEHCLYGVKVFSDFDLFDRPVPVTAVAPGEHAALQLRRAADDVALRDYTEIIPLYNSHGRDLILRTDRELARSLAMRLRSKDGERLTHLPDLLFQALPLLLLLLLLFLKPVLLFLYQLR